MLGDEHLRERQCPLDSAEEELFRRPVDRGGTVVIVVAYSAKRMIISAAT